ncbi:uncharacterized protein LOC143301651 [Babylonia areolata]|uniref:uncharacterized protein LOC143301651 n=1 Tax=Babylonia areolata TaxID=304850 RepID=UPI003FD1D710
MEGGGTPSAKDAEASMDMEEIRQRRLAYFQTSSPDKVQTPATSKKVKSDKQGCSKRSIPLTEDRTSSISSKTSEFHVSVKDDKEDNRLRKNHQSENHISFSSSRLSEDKPNGGSTEPNLEKRRGSSASMSDDHLNQFVKLAHSRSDVNITPTVSNNTPHIANPHLTENDRLRWATSANFKPSGSERAYRPVRNSGDKEVEHLFSNRKSTSASEIPALSLKESVDIDAVSVFKSKADFDELGLSTHRPESTTGSSISDYGEKRQLMRQRSMSSESLLLGSKGEEIRSLLGEQKYREFVEKSERELHQLHKVVESQGASVNLSGRSTPTDWRSRADGAASRNIPTPPPRPPSPQATGPSKRGPSPRRRLRSSSPQMMSRTLQDIARTKEIRESVTSRNYEQVVIPRNITFSADEIYRQAYGGDSTSVSDIRKSTSSMGSSYQDAGNPFWNTMTPRQMVGGMSPTSPQSAPMFQPHFMPVSAGGPMHPPTPQQPMSVGSPSTYYYPQAGMAVSMAGGGSGSAGQFVYSRQPNMFMPMSPGTSPQSPDAYFYQMHPLSQSMPAFHAPSSPMQSPAGLSWQYGHHSMAPEFQSHGQQAQEPLWSQYGPRVQQNSHQHFGQNWQHGYPPPSKVMGKGAGDVDKGKASKSSVEHADAVRLFHEQQRQELEKQAYSRSNSQASGDFTTSSMEHYFSSLGMPPPNFPPPPYHLHQPPPSLPSKQGPPDHTAQQVTNRQGMDTKKSSDSFSLNHSSDYDDMTTVTRTSWATGTSVRAGGITDRLEQIGVDPLVMQSIKHRSETAAADEEALEAMRNLVRICPECQAVNKEYMTWCLQCGGVLIGIDPIPAKDLKKKNREKKGSSDSAAAAFSSSKTRKVPSQGNFDSGAVSVEAKTSSGSKELSGLNKVLPVEVQRYDSQDQSPVGAKAPLEAQNYSAQKEPLLELEEMAEEKIVYNSTREQDQESSRSGQSPEVRLPATEPDHAMVEKAVETKESPESGRGASASSSPCRRNIHRDFSEDAEEASQHTPEVSDNKDSGRPSSGEEAESRKHQTSASLVPEDGPRRSEKEINEICEVINDPIIRGFIKSYLQKKPQDSAPVLSQPLPNKHRGAAHGSTSERRSGDTSKAGKKQAPKAFSVNLDSGINSTAVNSKGAPGRKEDTPKRKGQKKTVKKGHEAIDVEIFAIEEAKILRSSRSGANVVPKLNLIHSSDEEDDSSEKTSSLQGAASVGHDASSDTSSPREDFAPVSYSHDINSLAAAEEAQEENNNMAAHHPHSPEPPAPSQPNPELANSNFQFLKEVVENQRKSAAPERWKKNAQARQQPQHRPSPTSKVRASIEAPQPNRHWMRSSIAWSSYHPRELRTRSSLNMPPGGGGGSSKPTRQSTGNFRASRSTDNLVGPSPPESSEIPPSQRPRPASADQHNRRGWNRGGRGGSGAGRGQRPYSAGFYTTSQFTKGAASAAGGDYSLSEPPPPSGPQGGSNGVESPRCQDVDIEGRPIHRLAVQENTLPLIPAGPSTALKIYDRCFEQTPRDELEQGSKWLFLPDELWLHVFTYLRQVDLFHVMFTCKQLYRVALDPQMWKQVTVRKKSLQNEWLEEIARRHPVSLALVQCHGDRLSENTLRELFRETAPKLKELNFSRCSKGKMIGDEILLHASTYCRHLTHVDASWCHVTDVGLTALAGCCHRLESLCLNGCQQITDESLKTVVEKHGTSLRVLELFGCFSLTPASFRTLGEHCTFLLTLNMGQCYKISDSNMVTLSASLSRVETLDLRGCKKLGDSSIRKVVRSCRRLRHLILANCPLLSNEAIVEIAQFSTDIRSLDICGCSKVSDSSIQTLVNSCFRLTSIDISSTGCTHKSVLMLAEASRYLESAKFNFLADIHEQSLAKLIKKCKRLNTIHLYGCNVRDVAALKRYNRFLNIEM